LGHSERRFYFHESDEVVNRKVKAARQFGLRPIVCVGETLEQRKTGITSEVIETQVRGAFQELSSDIFAGTVIAYEPVWAIGTGLTATPAQAQEVHASIRGLIGDMFGSETANATRIQYGGSMKPDNAGELLAQPDIDGGLIGGASLAADSFAEIVHAAL
jgi:triosephosphate isomerase